MGYRLNRLDEPVFIAVSKPLLTEFGIHHRLESCGHHWHHLDKPVFMTGPKPLLTEFGSHHILERCGVYLLLFELWQL